MFASWPMVFGALIAGVLVGIMVPVAQSRCPPSSSSAVAMKQLRKKHEAKAKRDSGSSDTQGKWLDEGSERSQDRRDASDRRQSREAGCKSLQSADVALLHPVVHRSQRTRTVVGSRDEYPSC